MLKSIFNIIVLCLIILSIKKISQYCNIVEGFTAEDKKNQMLEDGKNLSLLKMIWNLWTLDKTGKNIHTLTIADLSLYHSACEKRADCAPDKTFTIEDLRIVKLFEYLLNSKKKDYTIQLQTHVSKYGTQTIQKIVQNQHLLNTILWNNIPNNDKTQKQSQSQTQTQNESQDDIDSNPIPTTVVHDYATPLALNVGQGCRGTSQFIKKNVAKRDDAYSNCMYFKTKNQNDLKYATWNSDTKESNCFTMEECDVVNDDNLHTFTMPNIRTSSEPVAEVTTM